MTAAATHHLVQDAGPDPCLLRAHGVGVRFEGLHALSEIDLTLRKGEILGLIGPNGAGKTTLLNVLSGFQKPTTGKVTFGGRDITGWAPHAIARLGLGRTFQAARLFGGMTVLENVEASAFGRGKSRAEARRRALDLLGHVGLLARRDDLAAALAYGEARLVGIARALALEPDFLMLDEPAAGMSPSEAEDLMRHIARIRDDFGCGIILIEHNMQLVMRVCDRVHVLARGRTIANGAPDEVRSARDVREAYLGQSERTGASVANTVAAPAGQAALLSVEGLQVRYGALAAVENASIQVCEGEFVAMIGPNGAGKSSLMGVIAGLVKPAAGRVLYQGQDIRALSASQRVAQGIALVPEGRRILSSLTVEENLKIGQTVTRHRADAADRLAFVLDSFPLLKDRFKGYAGRLSGGEQQQLAIARALLSHPRILLLDEPSLGLAPMMIDTVYEALVGLNKSGLTIFLMEQNAHRALLASHRAYVMRHGTIELEGASGALRDDPRFDQAYFGYSTTSGERR